MTAQEVRSALLSQDAHFQHLAEEHTRCETQLERILREPYLSSEDLILEVTLKKMKLRLKDQMESLVARHLEGRAQG